MCKSLDLNIVNGRKTGDLFGKYTCLKWNGNSVVDYLLTSSSIFQNVSSFKVGQFLPWLSDHCPIYFTLEIRKKVETASITPKLPPAKAPKQYVWSTVSRQKFLEMIKTDEFQVKWERSIELDHSDPNNVVNHITETLISAADRTKIKSVNKKGQRDPPWFDRPCQELKEDIKLLGKKIKCDPKNKLYKSQLTSKKKRLKKLVKSSKLNYKNRLMDEMNQSKKDSKKFWKLLDKLEQKQDDTIFKQGISDQRWVSHFKSIFQGSTGNKPLPQNTAEIGELDRDISEEEMKLAAYILRNGKSPGYDSISNEMLSCLLEARPDILKKLFNAILHKPQMIEKWCISMITPLHKSGSKMDPDNYRGISLLSCFSKFFTSILNQRLTKFAIDKKIFSKSQLGFLAGCRTSDALLILHNIIDYYCKKKNQYVFGCFVDFKKAFDSIPRHILFQKLLDFEINGKFYDCIVNMYCNDISCVKVADSITPSFVSNQGVKQGCILSPTLFNIFLADLQDITEKAECEPVNIKENSSLGCLIWADDLLLLSKTEMGLKNMLSALNSYTKKNGMTLNTTKTKVMIFNKNGRHIRRDIRCGNEKIETTRQYKYLGFMVTPSGEITTGLKDLKDRALRAFAKLKIKMGITFRKHPLITIKLFKSLIEPILLYASDFWGILKLPQNNPIENVFLSFCKQLLGVQKQTTNIGVLLELGQIPITLLAQKNAIKNWIRIVTKTKCNENVINSYENAVIEKLTWSNKVETTLAEIGMREQFTTKDNFAHSKAFQRMKDIFHQQAFADIQRENSKLRTYSQLKKTPGYEAYLSEIRHIEMRTALTKLRLSNHTLMIEKGRHLKIERNRRFCPYCPRSIEDEKHFLMECKSFNNLRNDLFDNAKLKVPRFTLLCRTEKFITLMGNSSICGRTAEFVFNALGLRDFLLNNHKVYD